MDDLTEEIRDLAVVRAIEHLISGKHKTKKAAAEAENISVDTLDRYMQSHKDIVTQIVDTQRKMLQARYIPLSEARNTIMDDLIRRTKNVTEMDPQEAMSLYNFIEQKLDKMEFQMGILGEEKESAPTSDYERLQAEFGQRLLNGPTLKPGIAKFTRTTETVEFTEEEPPIEGELLEPGKS